jgi:hypothetical protein
MRISTSPSGQTAALAGIGVALRPLWPVLAARGVFGVCFASVGRGHRHPDQ